MSFELLYMQVLCVGILILAAYFGGRLTRTLHLGEVVGQVIGGLLAGPIFLYLLEHKFPAYRQALESLHFFTFLFLSIIVFGIGDELGVEKLRRAGKDTIVICLVQAFATWAVVTFTFLILGVEPIIALVIGSIGIATAPAATFVIMNKLGITGKMRTMLGGIVVLDDVIEVILFSITVQVAIMMFGESGVSWGGVLLPVVEQFGLAILLGVGVFVLLRIVTERRWLRPKEKPEMGPVLGPEFLSRLISEMPGPSVETLVLICGCVSLGVALALHWHLPFLITAATAGILVSNLYSRQVFDSLRIENATSVYTLVFFALIGANAKIESFHPENFLYIGAYVAARATGKIGGTWLGCRLTGQETRYSQCLPKLMLPQAGVAAIEAFFVATVLGERGESILYVILPGLIIFEVAGVLTSERALLKWRSWTTGGGDLIGEEEIIRDSLKKHQLDFRALLHPECLRVPLDVNSKGEAIWELIQTVYSQGYVENPGDVLERILERERQGGTTLGQGIAIVHGRLPDLEKPVVVLGVLPRERDIQFSDAQDGQVNIIYMVLSPLGSPEMHLQILASIAGFLTDPEIRARLRNAENEQEAMGIIRAEPQASA